MIVILIALTIAGAIYSPDTFKSTGVKSYKVAIENPSIRYVIKPDDSNIEKLSYEPNISTFTALSYSTESFSIGASIQSDGKDPDLEHLDKSNVFDLQFVGVTDRFLWELYYQNYQGLYFKERNNIDPESLNHRADSYNYGLAIKYFSNKNFSPKVSLGNYSQDKKTGWSFVHGIRANKSRLKAQHNQSLVPTVHQADFPEVKDLTEIEITALGYSFGVAGLASIGQYFYMGGLFSAGMAIQDQKFVGVADSDRIIGNSNVSLMFDFGGGANGHYLGVTSRLQAMDIPIKDVKFSQSRLITSVYYNYYF